MPMLWYPTELHAASVEPAPAKRVQHDTLAEWQHASRYLTEKCLWFQAGVGRQISFRAPGRG